MPRKKASPPPAQASFLEVNLLTAPCVPAIREAIRKWKEQDCPGLTATTRTLLNYWFHTDHHLPDGARFAYFAFQQEAIETLVYLTHDEGNEWNRSVRGLHTGLEANGTPAERSCGAPGVIQLDMTARFSTW